MDFDFSRGNESPQETFFAMLHQYLVQLGCSQSASMLVEEAKVHFNSEGAFNDAYLYEWWCLLWSIHNSLKSPPSLMPPPMPPNRFDPSQSSQIPQSAPQQQPQYGQMLMQTPGAAPQTSAKAKPKKVERRPPKNAPALAPVGAPTPGGAPGSQAGLESLAIMVPGQVPLTVGRGQPPAKRHNLANIAMQRPQLQPQQRAAVSQQQMARAPQAQARNNRKPVAQTPQNKPQQVGPIQQNQQTPNHSQPQQSQTQQTQQNQPSQQGQPNQPPVQPNQGMGMSMADNYMSTNVQLVPLAPPLAPSLGPNSDPNLKPNLEPNLTNFALQPPPLMPGMNGDSLNGQPDGLMDNDFGMNFLGADLNMDLNGFDMTSMLK